MNYPIPTNTVIDITNGAYDIKATFNDISASENRLSYYTANSIHDNRLNKILLRGPFTWRRDGNIWNQMIFLQKLKLARGDFLYIPESAADYDDFINLMTQLFYQIIQQFYSYLSTIPRLLNAFLNDISITTLHFTLKYMNDKGRYQDITYLYQLTSKNLSLLTPERILDHLLLNHNKLMKGLFQSCTISGGEDEGWKLIEIYLIVYLRNYNWDEGVRLRGRCNNKTAKIETIQGFNNFFFKVLNLKSTNNFCGLECIRFLLYNVRKSIESNEQLQMKFNINFQGMSPCDFFYLSSFYLFNINIVNTYNQIVYNNTINPGLPTFNLLIHNNHYYIVKEIVQPCFCGIPNFVNHICIFLTVCPACNVQTDKRGHICPLSNEVIQSRNAMRREIRNLTRSPIENNNLVENAIHCLFTLRLSCFIIGPAGSGKTFKILTKINEYCLEHLKTAIFCATTGAAANLIENASTIHYTFGLSTKSTDLDGKSLDATQLEKINLCDVILIDEVSMLNGDLIDRLDLLLRRIKSNMNQAFGGIPICFIGDPLQLPPVKSDVFFFDSKIINTLLNLSPPKIGVYYTFENVRYKTVEWFNILMMIRIGIISSEKLKILNLLIKSESEIPEDYTRLYSTNSQVDLYNDLMLENNTETLHVYEANDVIKNGQLILENLAPVSLKLKNGAKVMLTVNHPYMEKYKIGNGSTGIIHQCNKNTIQVIFQNFTNVVVSKHKFFSADKNSSYREQFPLILSYAITIHKSQGITLDNLALSTDHIFEKSQLYVALSRCSDYNNIILFGRKLKMSDFKVNPRALMFADETSQKPLPEPDLNFDADDYDKWCVMKALPPKYKTFSEYGIHCKTIFFDCETYLDQTNFNALKIYCIEVIVSYKGTKSRKSFGKRDNLNNDVLDEFILFLWTLIEKDNNSFKNVREKGSAYNFFKMPYTICAFNGANFDFHFVIQRILNSMIDSNYQVNCLFKQSTVATFEIKNVLTSKKCLIFHDLYRILNCSLANASLGFLGKNIKGIFPHKAINELGYEITLPENQPIKLTRKSFFPNQLKELDYSENSPIWNTLLGLTDLIIENGKFVSCSCDLAKTCDFYCFQDVDILVQLYDVVETLFQKYLHSTVLKFFSLCQVSKFACIIHLPSECIMEKNDKIVYSALFRLTPVQEEYVSDAIYGGCVLVRKPFFNRTLQNQNQNFIINETPLVIDGIILLDVVSMYVSIMLQRNFCYGRPNFMDINAYNELLHPSDLTITKLLNNSFGFFVMDVTISGNLFDIEPPVPFKKDGKITWSCETRRAKYCHIDIALILRNGGMIHEIHSVLAWPTSCVGRLFESWMRKTLEIKMNGDKNGNEAERSFGKLLGNGTFGALCQRSYDNNLIIAETEKEFQDFIDKHHLQGMNQINNGSMLMWGQKKISRFNVENDENVLSPTAKHIGMYILAYSRLMKDDFITKLNPYRMKLIKNFSNSTYQDYLYALECQPYYGDTDSLAINYNQIHFIKDLLGNDVGMWTDDLNKKMIQGKEFFPGIITKFTAMAPKCYALEYTVPTINNNIVSYDFSKVKGKFRFKGIPNGSNLRFKLENEEINETFCYDSFDKIVKHHLLGNKIIADLNTIRKVGPKIKGHDLIQGRKILDLIGEENNRELLKTKWCGRILVNIHNKDYFIPIGFPIINHDNMYETLNNLL